jgi:glycosyltransferase involved in cell wall biosynthesis
LNCPNYIEQEKTDLIRNEFGIESDRKIILYLGGISEGRGVRYLLEAFHAISNHNHALVFIGYGDLEELVSAYSAKNKDIYLRKAVRPTEVIQYAASADIGVSIIEDNCLSYTYCLPNKLFEYTMAGIPTIISDLPEMRKVVDEYKIGIAISAKSNPELENALRQIAEMPADEMKENLKMAARDLNWENQEKFYIDTIREVINKRN